MARVLSAVVCVAAAAAQSSLKPLAWTPLAHGTVKPEGWLYRQLRVQGDGLSGHFADFWKPISENTWTTDGGDKEEDWVEIFPYVLAGYVPQAILLNDTHQLSVAENWIDTLLSRQTAEGWLGPPLAERGDAGMIYWPQWPIVLTFMAWREYTVTVRGAEDPRLIAASLAWLHNASGLMDVRPMGRDWSGTRWQDFVQAIQAIQDCPSTPASEQPFLAQLAQKVYDQGTKNGIDWAKFYTPGNPEFPTDAVGGWDYLPHGVNNAMAQKGGAVTWRAGLDPNGNVSSYQRDSQLTKYHGAPSGIFLADECLAGTMPSRGSETCLVVEQLFSMNVVHEIQGDAFFAERAETIAYNALPSTGTKDMWTRVYLQQPNEVFGGHTDPHPWETDGDDSTTYSLGDNYFCCTANFNQGWPRFVQRMLHASPDGGVAVSVLGPVSAVGLPGGAAVNVSGGYPFDSDDVTVTLSNLAPGAVAYPLYIRVPSWAANATLALADGSGPTLPVGAAAGTMLKVDWSALGGPAGPAVAVTLATAPAVRVEPHFNGALAVFRGPLLYSLRLDETFVVTTSAPGEPRAVDYVVEQPGCDRPNSGECAGAWNAALVAADAGSAAAGFTFSRTGPAPAVPFAAGLWGASNLEMMAQVRLVNSWGLALGSAAPPPSSPVDCSPSGACGDVYTATFVPFGATHLRISQLPYTPVPPCGSDVGYNASGVTTLPGGVDGASWDAYGGASITANGPDVNIRSGDPGDVGTAAYTATLRAPGHKVTGLALNFSYVAGYGGDGAPGGAVLSVVALAPGPCGGGAAPGPPLATLYTSAPLEHYPFDSNPRGYSPANPVVLPRGAFSLDASSGVVLAFRITNNQRNIQLKLPLPVTVWWD